MIEGVTSHSIPVCHKRIDNASSLHGGQEAISKKSGLEHHRILVNKSVTDYIVSLNIGVMCEHKFDGSPKYEIGTVPLSSGGENKFLSYK